MIKRICAMALAALLALTLAGAWAEVGMPNPWTETTAEGVMEALGLELGVPEGATDVAWRMLEEAQLAEMTFTWYEQDYTARVKPTDAFEDISGLYYEWPQEMECTVGGRCKGVCRRATDGDVTVDSAPGAGTTATVSIPKRAGGAASRRAFSPRRGLPAGRAGRERREKG